MMQTEKDLETALIELLHKLGYTYRPDISNNASLENNFKIKLENLNKVNLSDKEFKKVLNNTIHHNVFIASKNLRTPFEIIRDDDTKLKLELLKHDWFKNDFEVINQLKINTRNSYQRYDVIILINGLPLVQIELKKDTISPLKAISLLKIKICLCIIGQMITTKE